MLYELYCIAPSGLISLMPLRCGSLLSQWRGINIWSPPRFQRLSLLGITHIYIYIYINLYIYLYIYICLFISRAHAHLSLITSVHTYVLHARARHLPHELTGMQHANVTFHCGICRFIGGQLHLSPRQHSFLGLNAFLRHLTSHDHNIACLICVYGYRLLYCLYCLCVIDEPIADHMVDGLHVLRLFCQVHKRGEPMLRCTPLTWLAWSDGPRLELTPELRDLVFPESVDATYARHVATHSGYVFPPLPPRNVQLYPPRIYVVEEDDEEGVEELEDGDLAAPRVPSRP